MQGGSDEARPTYLHYHVEPVSPWRLAGPTLEGAREVGGVGIAQFETDVDEPRVRDAHHFHSHLKSDLLDQIEETEAPQGKRALEAAQGESADMGEQGCAGVAGRQERPDQLSQRPQEISRWSIRVKRAGDRVSCRVRLPLASRRKRRPQQGPLEDKRVLVRFPPNVRAEGLFEGPTVSRGLRLLQAKLLRNPAPPGGESYDLTHDDEREWIAVMTVIADTERKIIAPDAHRSLCA